MYGLKPTSSKHIMTKNIMDKTKHTEKPKMQPNRILTLKMRAKYTEILFPKIKNYSFSLVVAIRSVPTPLLYIEVSS